MNLAPFYYKETDSHVYRMHALQRNAVFRTTSLSYGNIQIPISDQQKI